MKLDATAYFQGAKDDIKVLSNGSVVECLTRDQEAAGLSLTGVTALWSLIKTHLS